jgi:hypothetical protein
MRFDMDRTRLSEEESEEQTVGHSNSGSEKKREVERGVDNSCRG